ncbi:MAG: hypothetical protein WBB27_15370 [Maribacter sp.]
MKGRKVVYFFVCLGLLFNGCSIDDDQPNFHFTALRITSANLPESFALNETYRVDVTFELPNGCSAYEGFDVTEEDTTVRNVVAIGSIRTDSEACTQSIIDGEAFFNFTVIYNEPYTFKFFQGENSDGEAEFLEVIVPVN